MTKIKKNTSRNSVYFIIVSVLAILGITLASALSITKSTDVNVYPVILSTDVDFVEDLQDVVNGDTIVNSVTLERATDSKDIFVRADLHYYKYGSLSDADKRFLLAINYDDISTYEGTSYKWVRAEDGYYYLTDPDGIPLKITDNTRYTFCEGITYQGAKCINNDTPAPLDLKLDVTIQAINSKNVTSVTLSNLTTLFYTYYGADSQLGYIVAFDTNNAGIIPAQTFLNNGQKVVQPIVPNKLGYKFNGWYTDSACTAGNEYDFNTVVSSNFTLYAKFDELPIQIIEDGQVIKEITNNNYTLSDIIINNVDLQNKYNFYNDRSLTDSLSLNDFMTIGQKIYVEPVTPDIVYTKKDDTSYRVGDNTTTAGNAYNGTSTDIVVLDNYIANGVVYPVIEIGQYSFSGNTNITSITIPSTITNIGVYAYNQCTVLTDINFNATACADLSGSNKIFYEAGKNTSGITVRFGANVTKVPANLFNSENFMLGFNANITNVVFTYNSLCESIGNNAFYWCTGLTSINLPSSLRTIGSYAFNSCYGLTSIIIPNNVSSIGDWAFYGCSKLVHIRNLSGQALNGLPNNIGQEILNDESTDFLNKLTIVNKYQILTVANKIYLMGFIAKTDRTTANDIPSFVTDIYQYAFAYCRNLNSVSLGDSVTSIGGVAFYDCTSLTGVYISDLTKWMNIDFYSYDSNPLYYAKKLYLNNVLVTSVNIPSTITEIKAYVFYNCTSITSVSIPDSVTSIGSNAFYMCTGLTGVYITDISKWMNIDFDNSASNPLDYAEKLYLNNVLVTSVNIPSTITEIKPYVFYNCTSLTSITIPDSVTNIGAYAFENCSGLMGALTIPDSVTSIGNCAFYGCSGLTSVTIPSSVTKIGQYAFRSCTKLTSITFEVVNGWYRTTSSSYTGGTSMSMNNASTNANNLKYGYASNYWYRV